LNKDVCTNISFVK